ncbi:UNVERIFIED_CONTAM: hypothetical protein GTU68_027554, partial [Idotea baltica]|nr:hypothetical protein [Idotea baltica]
FSGEISGLTPGLHGFHIHSVGDLGNSCKNAGGHFNPFGANHGDPEAAERHVGDLGNIEANDVGRAIIDIFDAKASMDPASPAYIGDRAIVVHAAPDDLGRGGNPESLKTGNAGARMGCGIIKVEKFRSSSTGVSVASENVSGK